MAATITAIGKYGQTSGSYPWTLTTAATINTLGADALLVFILNSNANKGTPTVKFGGSGGVNMTLLGSRSNGSDGKLFVFGLIGPAKTDTGSLYVNNPNENGDNTTIMTLSLTNVDLTAPWGAVIGANGVNGAAIPFTLTTTAAGSTVFGIHTSIYGPGVGGMSESGGSPAITQVDSADVDSSCVMKVFRQEVTASGGTAAGNGTINYSDHMVYQVEVKASSGPPKKTLTAPAIANTSGVGSPLVKDPNVGLLAPASIVNSGAALGSPVVTRQTVAFFNQNGAGNTISGSPATTVERTSVASNYRNSIASVPVVNTEKKYWEIRVDAIAATSIPAIGVGVQSTPLDTQLGGWQSDAISWDASGGARDNNTGMSGRPVYAAGDILMVAVDMANGWVFMGMNGQWYNGTQAGNVNFSSGDGRVNNSARPTSISLYPAVQTQNIGDKLTANFGRAAFAYTPPTGFTGLDAGGPVAKSLTVPSISNVNEFGSHSVALMLKTISPPAIVNDNGMGGHSVIQLAKTVSIENVSVLGNHNVVPVLEPAGLLNSSFLGSHAVGHILEATGIANSSLMGAPSLVQWLNAPGIEETPSVGTPVVGSSYSMAAPSIVNASALGDPEIKPKNTLAPDGIENIAIVGEPTVGQAVYAPAIVNVSAFGNHALNQGIKAPGIENIDELGSPTVNRGAVQFQPEGLLNTSEVGTPAIYQIVAPEGIDSTAALGNPFVTHIYEDAGVHPASIINVNEFGNTEIVYGIRVEGIAPTDPVFGSHIVAQVPKLLVPSIENASLLGEIEINYVVHQDGIGNISILGNHTIQVVAAKVMPVSIINDNYLGNPVVSIVVGESDKFIRHDGQWRAVETVLVKYESQWHELDMILEKKDGVWVQIF